LTDSETARTLRSGKGFRALSHPIYRLNDEKIVGYEMLSRGPAGPLEIPEIFFRVSMENKVLTEVDLHCMQRCIESASTMDSELWFHVNLYPSTVAETSPEKLLGFFPKDVKNWKFCIEIVEDQQVSDMEKLASTTSKLKKAGVKLAIDDVGFGASTLESLIVLEPDILKIDRRYVSGVAGDTRRERYLLRLIKVARALGAELVAEGIETRADLELMLEVGVEYGQGYLWGPPS
jgi:EAL domain-containing protein (putative c-di-GMP-specific phosphodiesterase class I)